MLNRTVRKKNVCLVCRPLLFLFSAASLRLELLRKRRLGKQVSGGVGKFKWFRLLARKPPLATREYWG